MWMLLKYEFRKTRTAKLIVLALALILQIVFLFGLYAEKEDMLYTGVSLMALLALCSELIIGIQSVVTLHRDLNTRQGYMLFMTPHSCYAVLGAKAIQCTVSILLAGAFFFGLGVLDVMVMAEKYGILTVVWEQVTKTVGMLMQELDLTTSGFAALVFGMLTSWICTVMTVFLADILAATIMNGKRYAGLLCFGLFIALSIAVSRVTSMLSAVTQFAGGMMSQLVIVGAVQLIIAGIMYAAGAIMMDRSLSV